jgi:hypothetical protein
MRAVKDQSIGLLLTLGLNQIPLGMIEIKMTFLQNIKRTNKSSDLEKE